MALFGEKYGKVVRVVTVPGYSKELCGGVHVHNTSHIGLFKILSETSTGAGVRRIEAVTGRGALAYVREQEGSINTIAQALKTRPGQIMDRIVSLQEEVKAEKHKNAELEQKMASSQVSEVESKVRDIKGVKTLVETVTVEDIDSLRNLGDQLRDKVGGVVVLASKMPEDKIVILTMATKEAIGKGAHAGKIVKAVAQIMGGGGGGRPDMAQAGAKDVTKLPEALEKAWGIVEECIK